MEDRLQTVLRRWEIQKCKKNSKSNIFIFFNTWLPSPPVANLNVTFGKISLRIHMVTCLSGIAIVVCWTDEYWTLQYMFSYSSHWNSTIVGGQQYSCRLWCAGHTKMKIACRHSINCLLRICYQIVVFEIAETGTMALMVRYLRWRPANDLKFVGAGSDIRVSHWPQDRITALWCGSYGKIWVSWVVFSILVDLEGDSAPSRPAIIFSSVPSPEPSWFFLH